MMLRPVDLRTLPELEVRRFHDFLNLYRAELSPEDPPIPFEERLKQWRFPPQHEVSRQFALLEGERVLGLAEAEWRDDQPESHDIARSNLVVAPEARRRGLGRVLARAVLEDLLPFGRTKLFFMTIERIPAGEGFARFLGAGRGLEEHTNQLLLSERNRAYIQRALQNAPLERFELVWFDSEYPESELEAICEVFELMNTAPRGDLEFNDERITPEHLRQEAADNHRQDLHWFLLLARERSTGRYLGFTETGWHPNRPTIVHQYGTGVNPKVRGHGLGAWLKAAMLERILKERPLVDRIRTGNADSNVPMLRINHSLGFKPFVARVEWQLDAKVALEGLRARAGVLG